MLSSRRFTQTVAVLLFSACGPSVSTDPTEQGDLQDPPRALFDPASDVLPWPSDAQPPASTTWARCGESLPETALRQEVLKERDGFALVRPRLLAYFSDAVAKGSLNGRAFMFAMANTAGALEPTDAVPIPAALTALEAPRRSNCEAGASLYAVAIEPQAPLQQHTTYAVALLSGITTTEGELVQPSAIWALARASDAPVVLSDSGAVLENHTPLSDYDQLVEVARAWQDNAELLAFLERALPGQLVGAPAPLPRSDILLAWQLTTESVSSVFDPLLATSPAAQITTTVTTPTIASTLENGADIVAAFVGELGASACVELPCDQVGALVRGSITAPQFVGADGRWDDPQSPTVVSQAQLSFLAVVPKATFAPEQANARPTVVFGHGAGRSKEDLLRIGAQLAALGLSSVAIDWPLHGERAVPLPGAAPLGCAGSPDPVLSPQCFVPLVTPDWGRSVDALRQGALDILSLVRALRSCGAAGECGALRVAPTRIGYLGQSLGAMLGAVAVAASPELQVAVLNVGGVGWLDLLADSANPYLRCPLVDALIDGGLLGGDKWAGTNFTTARCMTNSWRSDPGYLAYAELARWAEEPADGAVFGPTLAQGHRILLQEVAGDETVPASVSGALGNLLGLTPVAAFEPTSFANLTPSGPPGGGARGAASGWVRYSDVLGVLDYSHPSLLLPLATPAAVLASAQMQEDALYFLSSNL